MGVTMNVNCILFVAINLKKEEVEGKRVIEVGSCDINGSVRPLIESYKPKEYIGVDITTGPGVDIICNVQDLVFKFGKQGFDAVISTELLEHVKDWKLAIHNIKSICKTNGIILLTTRSYGFGYHGYPYDFWRYQSEDMEYIFSDCAIQKIEKDPQKGIFIKVIKPENFVEKDLSEYKLYSIVLNKRIKELNDKDLQNWYFKRLILKEKAKYFIYKIVGFIFSKL